MAIQPLEEEETENQAAYLPPADPVQRFKGGGLDTFDGDELNSPWSQCHQPSGPFGNCLLSGSSHKISRENYFQPRNMYMFI